MDALPPYFAGVLAGSPLVLAIWALAGTQRRAAAWSATLFGALGLLGGLFAGNYWNPIRLFGGIVGVEDVLFNMQMGVVVWVAASLPWRHRLLTDLDTRVLLIRTAVLTAPLMSLFLLARAISSSAMTGVTVAAASLLVLTCIAQPWRVALALCGAIGYALWYLPGLWLLCALRPELRTAWPAGQPWTGPALAGLPAGEWVWATLGGAAHAMGFAWVTRARLQPIRDNQ